MDKFFLKVIICALGMKSVFALVAPIQYPCLHVNNGDNTSYVTHDPNWDDQELIVNGNKVHSLHARLKPHDHIKICGLYSEFGIIFEDANQYYLASAEVSNDKNCNMTEMSLYPSDKVKYRTISQSSDSLSIKLLN